MKKSNKILAVVLALVMILTAVPMMTAGAAEETETPHKHEYIQQGEATKATCTEDGKATFKCECGDTQVEVDKATGHLAGDVPVKVDDNNHKVYCVKCKEIVTEKHNYVVPVLVNEANKAATCTEAGVQVMACLCGATKNEVVPATGHTYDVTKGFKDVEGKHVGYCTKCEKDVATAHSFENKTPAVDAETGAEKTEAAKCNKDGYAYYVCDQEGCNVESEKVVLAKGHVYADKWTEFDAKQHVKECSCGADVKEDHKFDVKVTGTATCTGAKATLTMTCSECGYAEKYDVIAKHEFGEYKPYSDDKHVQKCECGEESYGDHNWDEGKETLAPTCIKEGVKTFTCEQCKATKTEKIAMVDHTWGEWKETKPATFTEKGEKERTCTVEGCTAKETEEIAKLEYKVGDVNGDGKVGAVDARLILQHVANTRELSEAELARADIVGNGDGVKATDARKVLQIVAGLED